MFSLFRTKKPLAAQINQQAITVNPKETLLQAALREGIDFPHGCRVGGCAACKCRLLEGKVKELTEAGYILSDDELDQGFILACQSVPQTPVRIAVDLSAQSARRQVPGRVIAQDKLTHDITRLRVQLDSSLHYKAGQYADIRLERLPALSRSYSFATPVTVESQVSFFVREVPGGPFSTLVNRENLLGERLVVDGPVGDFWLRPADAPLLLVAGGSGLAPILALLQGALAEGVRRPVVLLFGARTVQDLYAQDDIQRIAQAWNAGFQFVPVLSAADSNSLWAGERGLVTEKIPALLPPGAHAYLCGPPPMIDSAVAMLRQLGVAQTQIHTDRFTNRQDALAATA